MSKHRVVVTGLGCISALGNNVKDFWSSLCNGRSAIGPLTLLPSEQLNIKVAAEVKDFNPNQYFEPNQLTMLDRFSQFALVAAREAVNDAGLTFDDDLGEQTAIILGNGAGGKTTDDAAFKRLYADGNLRSHPMTILRLMGSAATSQVSAEFGITGPAFSVTSACASAGHAIGQAFALVRQGAVSAALTGGSEACLTLGTIKAWEAMRVMSPDTCRPFSHDREGMVLGEGGGVLVLETLERATRRDARIYAELVGFGMSADAGHITRPSEAGAARAIKAALDDAGLQPEDIDYVNAHGTGTLINDVSETQALHLAFGQHAKKLAISSTKSMHGHTLGASGAIELIATILANYYGVIPPTANFTKADPKCDLDYVPNQARESTVTAAVSNSFAFGGLNAVLASKRFA